jgi:trk system potassium uptake protein TrkA
MADKRRSKEFAVIGLGRFGSSLARELEENGFSVMAVDIDAAIVQEIAGEVSQAIILDSTSEEALAAAGIDAFDTVVVSIGVDFEANLLTTASLKQLGVKNVICKTGTDRQRDILLRVGADKVVQPEQNSGQRLAEELGAPSMLARLPLGHGKGVFHIQLPQRLTLQTVAQSELDRDYELVLLAIQRGENIITNPPYDTIFMAGDLLIVSGSDKDAADFCSIS